MVSSSATPTTFLPIEEAPDGAAKPIFQIGAIVWAKMKGYPMWPAIISQPKDYPTFYRYRPINKCVF